MRVALGNPSTSTIYLGGDDVTTLNGFPLRSGESMVLRLTPLDVLYAVVASGTADLKVFVQAH